ncbi:hypothetical protein ABID21_002544 [Pseudorhizobium tarimense]|uniref:Uncharacterized protein n=1 Tax=Pseudorhizobium tarimense TaxID=1079109 RepID=A0ABV2H7D4_9HYPH
MENFSHARPASEYSLSNGAETALTARLRLMRILAKGCGQPVRASNPSG